MRHARPDALDRVDDLLAALRKVPGLVEKKRGVFSRGSRAFLHFHEDPSGLHVDVRLGEDFDRYRVETKAERRAFLALVRAG